MPELPEVEVTRRQLEPLLVGRRVVRVFTTAPSYFFLTPPASLQRRMRGRRFEALDRTGKYLLARTLMAYRVGLQMNDQKFFHDNLVKVLETPPSIWPEQRLANEVAHRRARRYLSHEKELFE